ncbi:hypothetical protein B0H17DRAFT_1176573 [Mycena rosella]|uniref:Uncharacterized protein n=1 Tax=Mycena rosella TaxID=1033263 RepID=A0AAD7DYW2_MYCRO|nr:hypothetical protein B0H17DRAFT_1176573 [Mycena rosella]
MLQFSLLLWSKNPLALEALGQPAAVAMGFYMSDIFAQNVLQPRTSSRKNRLSGAKDKYCGRRKPRPDVAYVIAFLGISRVMGFQTQIDWSNRYFTKLAAGRMWPTDDGRPADDAPAPEIHQASTVPPNAVGLLAEFPVLSLPSKNPSCSVSQSVPICPKLCAIQVTHISLRPFRPLEIYAV